MDSAKQKLASRLRIQPPAPGACHFPLNYRREYFEQLTAERLTHIRGQRAWVKPRDARNEVLDARVLALAALHGLYQHGVRRVDLAEQFEQRRNPKRSEAV